MLTFESTTLGYGGRAVLAEVALGVEKGEVVAVVGPNGAGKSTLVRAASGVLAPLAGRVAVDGEEIHRLRPEARARRIAVVPQSVRLPEAFTALETVLMGRTPYLGWLGRESAADRKIAAGALERTGTAALAERRLGDLSSGEQQLVLIARALAQSTPYLLLDEPTAHLDLRHQAAILGLVRELAGDAARGNGPGVLVALHDLNHAARYADRVAILAHGRILAAGSPREVLTAEQIEKAFGLRVAVVHTPGSGRPAILLPEKS